MSFNGYIEIFRPAHPLARCTGYVYEHTLVMEMHLGRHLASNEVIEHINALRFDNRIENLKLFSSNSEHKMWEYFKPLILRGGDPLTHKLCTGCDSIKPRDNFRKYNVYPDKRELYCNECRSQAELFKT